jgi:hypothetical protein
MDETGDTSAEREALRASLRAQRAHVLGILEGLDDADLRRPVLPTGWSCLGLVQHLALDVERFWFRAVAAGEQVDLETGDGGWRVSPDVPVESVLDLYSEESRLADAVIEATPLDAMPAWWPDDLADVMPPRPLRRTVLHVITETAAHAGHLDAARELIDGRTWLVLTD